MRILRPPTGYLTWLDYAVDNMTTRTLYISLCFGNSIWPNDTTIEEMMDAVREELKTLRDHKRSRCHDKEDGVTATHRRVVRQNPGRYSAQNPTCEDVPTLLEGVEP